MPMEYDRAQTAYSMAVAEIALLKDRLRKRAKALRKEADEIDAFLRGCSKNSDGWYLTISKEYADEREAQKRE